MSETHNSLTPSAIRTKIDSLNKELSVNGKVKLQSLFNNNENEELKNVVSTNLNENYDEIEENAD